VKSELRYRQIHLDFHTSEHIPNVGARFEKEQFIGALKRGNVDSVTVFARGHHGWCYYPSKIGKPHPNLVRPDLLGEMVTACKENDINVPIYHTVQWDERIAREHPGWRVMPASSAMNQLTPVWHPICLNNPEYLDYLCRLAVEVVGRYEPDGVFMDILAPWECVCPRCLASMRESGLDPERKEDRLRNDRSIIMEYYRTLSAAVWAQDPDMRIFHNSGNIYRGERDRYRYFSHLEVESLPTGGWGYDHFPVTARYINTLGIEYLGMTGRFHTTWGEFGGYKRPIALEYECAAMVAFGARCSIGDQLHPSGEMDPATYDIIAPAYRRVERLEPFARGAVPVSEIAVLSAAAHASATGEGQFIIHDESDDGASRMLLELHEMFDVVDIDADFSRYRLLVLPDTVTLNDVLRGKIEGFLARGGRLILSGASGMTSDEDAFALPFGVEYDGKRSAYSPDYIEALPSLDRELPAAPFVVYERAYAVKAGRDSQALAGTRLPYFNRRWDHFSSHQHAPARLEPNAGYDAVIRQGNIIYFSHPVFRAYYRMGQPLLKYLFRGALDRLLPDRRLHVEMPTSGRISLMQQRSEGRLLLHLLFGQTQLRGAGTPASAAASSPIHPMEIIEDVVPIFDVTCTLRLPERPRKVSLAYDGSECEFAFAGGVLTFKVPKVYVHELVVIETEGGPIGEGDYFSVF
jgi:hypothetical protein